MGKNYRKELDVLDRIYENALKAKIDIIADFVAKYSAFNLYGIGSGGSYSVAAAFEYLCTKAGIVAKRVTPLELGQLECQVSTSAAVLFSAGGSNNDSKNAYRYMAELEPEGILTCCMRLNAPIKKLQKSNLHNYYYEYKMPVAKDGYLAVESTMSSIVLMVRAMYKAMKNDFFLLPEKRKWGNHTHDINTIKNVVDRETILILHGGITVPAAIDLESKFSEASLGNTQLVDFRNFAHGRHYWVSDRKKTTSIIALVGNTEKKLADNTLRLLPEDIPVLRFDVNDDTAEGMIEAFHYVFEIVGEASAIKNIDPGKPHIEEFGKKLYHLNYDIGKKDCMSIRRKNVVEMAAYRKVMKNQGVDLELYHKYSQMYFDNLHKRLYRGLIFDYDGTLHDKGRADGAENEIFAKLNELLDKQIAIGIATGRGKSVRNELQKKISKKHWGKVLIAYYNGGVVGRLDDDSLPNKEAKKMPTSFLNIIEKLQNMGVENNPYQLTLDKDKMGLTATEFSLLKEKILQEKGVKVMDTDHSIDIVPLDYSKRNIFRECQFNEDDYLTIGDSGYWGGNDYELLRCNTGLSVDYVSNAFDSCWNYAPPGIRNLEATDYYLNMVDIIEEGFFCLKG